MATPTSEPAAAYLVDRRSLGVLKFTGATRLDLIHRMSTQDVKDLPPGEGAATILTTDIGRIVDRLLLYAAPETVYAITGENNAEAIARYLLRFVFFMDDFQVENLTPTWAVWGVYGAGAATWLAGAGWPVADLLPYQWRRVTLPDGLSFSVHRADPVAGGGFLVLVPSSVSAALPARLIEAGAALISAETFDYLRLESGLPRFGRELTPAYIPLEANLWADVSFKKGCYIGQEIIARLESRGRLAKRMLHFHADHPLASDADIRLGDNVVGALTSAANGPRGTFALGYVKTSALAEPAPALTVGDMPLTLLPA